MYTSVQITTTEQNTVYWNELDTCQRCKWL